MKKILITGATGFVGRHLCELLVASGYMVSGTSRASVNNLLTSSIDWKTIGDLGSDVDWRSVLQGIDYVVHLAARVHVMRDSEADPLGAFRRINVSGTERLVQQACDSGVKRFIYLSSIKVLGDATVQDTFVASDIPLPSDPYGQSKLEAEQVVEKLATLHGMDTVIIRPPLVSLPELEAQKLRVVARHDVFSYIKNRFLPVFVRMVVRPFSFQANKVT